MAYIVSIDPNLWASTYLQGKKPESVKSSLRVGLRGNNAWGNGEQLIIDGTPGGYALLTIDLLEIRGQVRSETRQVWTTSTGIPTTAAPFVALNAGWIETRTMSIFCNSYGGNHIVEGVDWIRDKANSRVRILNESLFGKEVQVGYWETPPAFTYQDSLNMTVENLMATINNASGIGVIARPVIGVSNDILLESLFFGTDADKIEISRANVLAGEILLNGQDINGPVTLAGDGKNITSIAVSLKISEQEEYYIEGIPGVVISPQHPKEFSKEDFEGFDDGIKSDIALFVSKGILRVLDTDTNAYLTANQVLHAGYIDVKVIP